MPKFGRKLCCKNDKNVQCFRLRNGEHRCSLAWHERTKRKDIVIEVLKTDLGNMRVRFCCHASKAYIAEYMDALKKDFAEGRVKLEGFE